MKPVIVYTWHDYCDWLRSKGQHISDCDALDPWMIGNHAVGLQAWHKDIIEKHAPEYVVCFRDSGGLIVLGLRELYPAASSVA